MSNKKTLACRPVFWAFLMIPALAGFAPGAPARETSKGPGPAKAGLLKACATAEYAFTPEVRKAYLAYAREQALSGLKAGGQSLPEEFMDWVDSDPAIAAGVYGAHHEPSEVLLWLYSLRLDLGKEKFEKYRQLALATALVSAKEGMTADLTPRSPLKLVIPGDPRRPVDTTDPNRQLDLNDHIINFLNRNTIEEEVVAGHKEVLPELKYDDKGIAIPAPKGRKPKKVPVTEKRTRTLYAADVMASSELQQKFNACMAKMNQDVRIDCGDKVIHWDSCDAVHGEQYKKIDSAYMMFRKAYEAKGLLPARRDPFASPAERCAYLIRNAEHTFPPDLQADRKWPRFPLTAPWPVLTMLAADNQPLREREERWTAFRDKGEFMKYGEYIGAIAQQHAMQSARRLKPYPFTYATVQMMLKDGGVCGSMGAISSRSHNTLGIPASQAIQPGHCAMVAFHYDPKTGTYSCKGGQYATGGDEKTTPFTPWPFENVFNRTGRKNGYEISFHNRKPMVYHQSIAWGLNHGPASYYDSILTHAVFRHLPEDQQKTHGIRLLASGLERNPYSFLLVDEAQAALTSPREQIAFWKGLLASLQSAGNNPGCPAGGLYNTTIKSRMFARIAELPVPGDQRVAREILTVLEAENCGLPAPLVAYRLAVYGLPDLLNRTERAFVNHLKAIRNQASRETDAECKRMAEVIKATADRIEDKNEREEWAQSLWEKGEGHAKYFGHRHRVSTHPALPALARLSGQKMPPESELMKPLLRQIAADLARSLAAPRNIKECRALAARIKAAGGSINDQQLKRAWCEQLSRTISGKETFTPAKAKKNAKPARDPCADAIKALSAGPPRT